MKGHVPPASAWWEHLLAMARMPPPRQALAAGDPLADRAQHQDRDTSLFDAFFQHHNRQITHYLLRLTGDAGRADELAQETFLRAWQHFDTISTYEQPLAWLFRVATNLARQHHRQQSPVRLALPLADAAASTSSDPALQIVERDQVRQVLLELPFPQRAALILREVHGFSCAEIGELLGISRGNAKMTLWRAREHFRATYLRTIEGEP